MTLAAALAIAFAAHAARGATLDHSWLHCASYQGREVGLPSRYHTVACGDVAGGPIAGFVLRRNGSVRCAITGWHGGGCVVVDVCGQESVTCE